MKGFSPGECVLFRDGDRYCVAKVDLVKERHLTAFTFDATFRRWSAGRRRIAADFVIGKLISEENAESVAIRINRLANEREALRQQANRWLEDSVRQLAVEAG